MGRMATRDSQQVFIILLPPERHSGRYVARFDLPFSILIVSSSLFLDVIEEATLGLAMKSTGFGWLKR